MATILCVDDDPEVGLILEETLQRAGHQTRLARHVPEALQALAEGGVDLVISDYRMPGITGIEFISMLQKEGHDVPLIMLTGHASIEHAVTAIRAGAVDCITALAIANGAGAHDPDAIVLRTLNVSEAESVLIEHALERASQNRTRAAELLGISVRTLRNRLNSPAKVD